MTLHHRRAKQFLQGTLSILVRVDSFDERSLLLVGFLKQDCIPSCSAVFTDLASLPNELKR